MNSAVKLLRTDCTVSEDAELADVLERYFQALEAGAAPSVEELLAQHPALADRLQRCLTSLQFVEGAASQMVLPAPLDDLADENRRLGDYRLIREIGRGGMGIVYEAEQISLARRVALKVLPFAAVLDSRQLQRFQNEALAAANLDHPNIVAVHGIGCERGVHFYVMRLVTGATLAEVVAARRSQEPGVRSQEGEREGQAETLAHTSLFSPSQLLTFSPPPLSTSPVLQAALSTVNSGSSKERFRRLAALGIEAAEALDHAHQMGVVHRDIKPSNLLIDERGKLWVTDFGLAQVESNATLTLPGDLLGTLRYMSPEQAAGRPTMIDHRTDIYSLGATLYELATDRPVVQAQDRAAILREIAETDPAPPRKFTPAMPADFETILLKCLAKEPSARYDSAAALADDLRRFLEQKPVVARRPGTFETVTKLARRHQGIVVAASVAFIALVAGLIGTTWQAIRATEAERVAELDRAKAIEQSRVAKEEAAIAQAIGEFLQDDLLMQAAPELNPRHEKVSVEELLDRAAQNINDRFADQPKVEMSLRKTMGEAYARLGNYAAAQQQLEIALKLLRQEYGDRHDATIDTMSNLADMFRQQGQPKRGEPLAVQALKLSREVYGNAHPDTMLSVNNLAAIYGAQAKYDLAEPLLEEAFETLRQNYGLEDAGTLAAMNNLAMVYSWQGKFVQAERMLVQALENAEKALGPEAPDTLSSINNLAACYKDQGKYDQAEPLFQRTLDAAPRVLGPESPGAIMAMNNMASLRFDQGRFEEAELLFLEALELVRRVQGRTHPHTLTTTESLAKLYIAETKYDEAESLLQAAIVTAGKALGGNTTAVAVLRADLGEVRLRQGRLVEAEVFFRESLPAKDSRQADDWMWSNIESLYGEALLQQEKYAEAEPLLLAGYRGLKSVSGQPSPSLRRAIHDAATRLVNYYAAINKPDEAAKWTIEPGSQPLDPAADSHAPSTLTTPAITPPR